MGVCHIGCAAGSLARIERSGLRFALLSWLVMRRDGLEDRIRGIKCGGWTHTCAIAGRWDVTGAGWRSLLPGVPAE